jgi:formylglycine-generating enzyme
MTGSFAPRPIDLPTGVPLQPDADLSVLDDAKILAAPADAADREAWRTALHRWRREARRRMAYDDSRYRETTSAWASRAWNVVMVWMWDEALYDWESGQFDCDRLLATYACFGGLDAVVLWHAYPVIGIDPRNQFDWYRDVPGLAALVDQLHRRGVRVFVDYNPWDVGTRRAAGSDAEELAGLVKEIGCDGVFLDTLKEGDPELLEALGALDPAPVLEGESRVPLGRIADHQASWAQWFADSDVPGVLRARWFEQRHMMHYTRRWNRDHRDEIASAWVNGAGVLIWDVVFGVWVGWNQRDLASMRAMRRVHRAFKDHLVQGDWEPLTPLAEPATAAGVHGSRWSLDDVDLWTVVSRGPAPYQGWLLDDETSAGGRLVDVITGEDLDATASLRLAPGELGGVVRLPAGTPEPPGLTELREAARADAATHKEAADDFPRRPIARVTVTPRFGLARPDAVRVERGHHPLGCTYRQRETGMYEEASYVDDWKPLPPRLHGIVSDVREVEVGAVAVDAVEVTNAEFAEFLAASGYTPKVAARFLAHWVDGHPVAGTEQRAVTYVDLDDARAYARWCEARLPTEDEWQLASGDPRWRRDEPMVWNWTESEHRDGRTRWTVPKGGSWFEATGSEWYVDGGPRPADWSVRLLRTGGGTSRSACIGFRCAVDLDPAVTSGGA